MQNRAAATMHDELTRLVDVLEDLSVSAEKRAEAARRLRKELDIRRCADSHAALGPGDFKALVENSPDVILRVDRQLRIAYINPAVERYTGRPPGDYIGKMHRECGLSPEAIELWESKLRDGFLEKRAISFDFRLDSPEGSRWHHVRLVPEIHKMSGEAVSMICIGRDVTEQKQAEDDLKAAKEAAEMVNRTKDQFLAALSHELRTPLTPVLTTAQLIEMDRKLPPDLREPMSMICRNVELETRLIDDLLDLTRISRGKMDLQLEVVDLHEKIPQIVRMYNDEIRTRRLGVIMDLNAQRHHVLADPARVQQVVWNLLKNAVKFTPCDGRITIVTENRDPGCVAINISDTGMGIEPELLPRVFDPFEQGGKEMTRRFGGLGLGLAISKGLADLHHGTLKAWSEGRDKGATFALELPTVALQPAAFEPESEGEGLAHFKGGRLLLVEDHVDTANTMAQLLEEFGYEVRIAGTVAAALEAAEREHFDFAVCDIGLPDGNGLDLMRQLAEQYSLKGIALSGYGMDEDIRKSHEAGFAVHLTKPINLQQLEDALRKLDQ